MRETRIVRSVADSLTRLSEAKAQAVSSLDKSSIEGSVSAVTKPNSPSKTLKKAGVALIVATPDPVTAVPGVALLVASYAIKRNEPAKLDDLAVETRKILRDIESLSL